MASVALPHPAPSTIPVLPGHARANREGGLPKLPRHGQKFALAVLASVASRRARSRVRLAASPLLQGVRTFEQSAGRELQNVFLDGNFAPVTEEVSEENLQVVEGRIPEDFPSGMFVRNGPNPRFKPDCVEAPLLGRTVHHWFEGDGMLHAVRFHNGQCSYRNRYIRTPDFDREETSGECLYRGIVDTTSLSSFLNPIMNMMSFGTAVKDVANTSVLFHGGRLLALVEGEVMPVEVGLEELDFKGHFKFGQEKVLPSFTAHPKIDPITGDMVFTAYSSLSEPPVHAGVVGPDGNLKHWTTVKSATRKTLMHDCAITERFTLILDFPLTIDVSRLFSGGQMIGFEESPSRIGVMPRYGEDVERWFKFSPGYGFHMLNAFEDGDEVVLRGCRADIMVLTPPWEDGKVDRRAFMEQYFETGSPKSIRLHEWRMNMVTGSSSERDLGPPDFIDFPTVSPKVVGKPHDYGYSCVFSKELSCKAGSGVAGALRKYTMPSDSQGPPSFEDHVYGEGISGQEGIFVPRPGATEEDDGWVLVFTHEEGAGSELRIIDARNFCGPPCARIAMPQRVPYGFHGTFVPL